MKPLLRPGDTLLVEPYGSREIQPGDVVVFSNPRTRRRVVHRVVAASAAGVTTKGDNSSAPDNWVLPHRDIVGRVEAIRRQGRLLPMPRQAPASLHVLQGRQWCDRLASRLLHPLYHGLARSRLLQGRLPAWLNLRLLCFPRPDGHEWQLWLGSLLIGRKQPQQPEWYIRRPFRLFVDVASLPGQSVESPGHQAS